MIQVENYLYGTSQLAQTTLRSVCGQAELDELLADRERINHQLQEIIDQHTEPWGVKVRAVEIKHIDLPQEMQRAMAKQAEAERERRAKVIHAEGEFQAAQRLAEAARVLRRRSRRSSSATCRRSRRSRPRTTRPRSSRCRSTSCGRSTRARRAAASAEEPRQWPRRRRAPVDESACAARWRARSGNLRSRRCCSACSAPGLSLGAFTLEPGQPAVLLRLGRHARTVTRAGLPLDAAAAARAREIVNVGRGAQRGLRLPRPREPARRTSARTRRAMQTSDNNIVRVSFAVQYRIKDAFAARYRVADPAAVVRDAAPGRDARGGRPHHRRRRAARAAGAR